MIIMTLRIKGMSCGMCEAHVNDALRKACPLGKVRSSFRRGRAEIVMPEPMPAAPLRQALADIGYEVTDVKCAPQKKPSFLRIRH